MNLSGRLKWKKHKIILVFTLIAALIFVQSLQIVANASQDGQMPDLTSPTVTVNDSDSLYQAVQSAADGDVIGINGFIDVTSGISEMGSSDKTLYLVRMNEGSYLKINGQLVLTNMIIDGNSLNSSLPMLYINDEGTCYLASCTVQNCINQDNGGAIYSKGTVNLQNSILRNNQAKCGGHIYIASSGGGMLYNSEAYNGSALDTGGAIYNGYNASFRVLNSQIHNNTAASVAGGIYNNGSLQITQSAIYGNSAPNASDIANTQYAAFEMPNLNELAESYQEAGIIPTEWVSDVSEDISWQISNSYDLSNTTAMMKLIYQTIGASGDTGENDDPNGEDGGDSENSGNENNTENGGNTENSGNSGNEDKGNSGGNDNTEDSGNSDNENDTGDGENSENSENNEDSGNSENENNTGDSGNTDNDGSSDNSSNTVEENNTGNNNENSEESGNTNDSSNSDNNHTENMDNESGNNSDDSNSSVDNQNGENANNNGDTGSNENSNNSDHTENAEASNTDNSANSPSNSPDDDAKDNSTNQGNNSGNNADNGNKPDTGTSNSNNTNNTQGDTSTSTTTNNTTSNDSSDNSHSDSHNSTTNNTTNNYYNTPDSGHNSSSEANGQRSSANNGSTTINLNTSGNASSTSDIDANTQNNLEPENTTTQQNMQLPDNLKLNLTNVDVFYEMVDGRSNIEISSSATNTAVSPTSTEEAATQTLYQEEATVSALSPAPVSEVKEISRSSKIDWYEIIKIALLGAIIILVLPKKNVANIEK